MLKILISDPGLKIIKDGNMSWLLSTVNNGDVEKELHYKSISRLYDIVEEGNIYKIKYYNDNSFNIEIFKSITSNYEVFYYQSGKDIFIADHFRNILKHVDKAKRKTPYSAVIDHYLFQTVTGYNTYIEGIKRLGHGEMLCFDSKYNIINTEIVQKIDINPSIYPSKDKLNSVMENVMTLSPENVKRPVNLLTGGIDSSLLQTYLGNSIPSLHVGINTKDFLNNEVKRSIISSELLGTNHKSTIIQEQDYFKSLLACIASAGMPSNRLYSVLLNEAFKEDFDFYYTGQLLEALFGLPVVERAVWVNRLGLIFSNKPIVKYLNSSSYGKKAPTKIFYKNIDESEKLYRKLKLKVDDPCGFALSMFNVNTDLAEKAFPKDAIENAYRQRFEYVSKRVNFCFRKNNFYNHLEVGHIISLFCDNHFSFWRQLAFYHKSQVYAPALSKKLLDYSLKLNLPYRYYYPYSRRKRLPFKSFERRYIIKNLLQYRLPNYPFIMEKGGSRLPLLDYIIGDGPLSNSMSAFDVPDFIDQNFYCALDSPDLSSKYFYQSTLTYCIWRDEVLMKDDLDYIGDTKIFDID